MHIEFSSNKLKGQCQCFDEAQKAFNKTAAKKLIQRLLEMKAAPSLKDLSSLPPIRCHPLTGNKTGRFAVNVNEKIRIVFEPICDNKAYDDKGGLDYSKVVAVKIIEVVNYHE
jgi:proteic killer suppression protein